MTTPHGRRSRLGIVLVPLLALGMILLPAPRALADTLSGADAQAEAAVDASQRVEGRLLQAGFSEAEADALLADLSPRQRLLLDERTEHAEAGGFHVAIIVGVALLVTAGVVIWVLHMTHHLHWFTTHDHGPHPQPPPPPGETNDASAAEDEAPAEPAEQTEETPSEPQSSAP